jgi:hypothetical protein
MSFFKIGSLATAELISLADWRGQVVSAQIRQDPTAVDTQAKFDVNDEDFLYVRVRAVSAGEYHGPNQNGDWFGEGELKRAFKTFVRRGVYLDHQSDSVDKAVGIILDATYHETPGTHYVELLLAVDKSLPIADKISKGYATDVSMGALVARCQCNICDKIASSTDEYCDHLRDYMGKEYNGRKVYAINHDVNFYEISWVTVGADPLAKSLQIMADVKQANTPVFERMIHLAEKYADTNPFLHNKITWDTITLGDGRLGADIEKCAECGGSHKKGDSIAWNKTTVPFAKEATPPVPEASKPQTSPVPPAVKKPEFKKPEPAPKDESLGKVVEKTVEHEVEKGVERTLIDKVRQTLQKMKPAETVMREVPDEEITRMVREELARKTRASANESVESAIHAAVDARINELDAEHTALPSVDLGNGYSVSESARVAGVRIVQLYKEGNATGLYPKAYMGTPVLLDEPVIYYRDKFSLMGMSTVARKTEPETDSKIKHGEIKVSTLMTIQYVPGKTLDTCTFVARRGNMEARTVASALLNAETQKAIVTGELTATAKGKVQVGVPDNDITKGKVDHKQEEGKEEQQPSAVVKNVGGVEKLPPEYSADKDGYDQNSYQDTHEPIQPNQVVSKYASLIGGKITAIAEDKATGALEVKIEGGSLLRLAQYWRTRVTLAKAAALAPKAKIGGQPGGWAKEVTTPLGKDPAVIKDMLARQMPTNPDAKPKGSLGSEQIKYYAQFDKAQLSEGGQEQWAKRIASLNKKATELETENRVLKATLEKVSKQQEAEKKGALVEAIMNRMAEAGALTPDIGAVLELKERGLDHEDAVAKASANLRDRQLKELAALDVTALEKMKNIINRSSMNARTAEPETMKSIDVPIVGNVESSGESAEDRLASGW